MRDAPENKRDKIIVAANPFSGSRSNRPRVGRLVAALEKRGLEARVAWSPGERSALLGDAGLRAECHCVVAAGGDGTVHSILAEDLPGPLAAMPLGTENLFARHFGFTRDAEALAERIARGQVLRMDLGRINGRFFALMFGAGIDAEIAHRLGRWRTKRSRLRRVNYLSYVPTIVSAFRAYRFPRLELVADGERATGRHAFVFNLPSYAMRLPLGAQARSDDGLLDWIVFERPGRLDLLRYAWALVRGKHLDMEDVKHGRARRVHIASEESVPVQVDGDPCGTTPAEAEVVSAALRVVGPVA